MSRFSDEAWGWATGWLAILTAAGLLVFAGVMGRGCELRKTEIRAKVFEACVAAGKPPLECERAALGVSP